MENQAKEKESEEIEKKIINRNFWEEFGENTRFNNLKSWKTLKIVRLSEYFLSLRKIYRKSLFSKDSEQLQKDFASILMATSIILALVLQSTLSSLGDISTAIHPDNMFQSATEAFVYISKILGYFSFASSASGTFYTVAVYSNVACVSGETFSSFIDGIGNHIRLIWFFPYVSIGTYFASTTVKFILINDLAIGITTLISAVSMWLIALVSFAITESLHGLVIIITAKCKEEERRAKENNNKNEEEKPLSTKD